MPKRFSIRQYTLKRLDNFRRKIWRLLAPMDAIDYIAAGGVIIHNGQMLLLDRPHRGEIRLPKGHVDPGESHDETALRETVEETGYGDLEIVADLGERLVEYDNNKRRYRRLEHYYLMRKVSDRQVPRSPKDEAQFHPYWAPVAEAVKQLTYLAEQEVALRAITTYQAQTAQDIRS